MANHGGRGIAYLLSSSLSVKVETRVERPSDMGLYACTLSFQAFFNPHAYPGSAVLRIRDYDLPDGTVLEVIPTTDCIDTGYLLQSF